MSNHYTYRAEWSPEDEEYVGLVAEFPSLSWLAATAAEAVAGAAALVDGILDDMAKEGETPPVPLTERRYSGNLSFRTSPAQHRALAIEAAEQGVSVNQWLVYKTMLQAHLTTAADTTEGSGTSGDPVVVVEHRIKADPREPDRYTWDGLPEGVRSEVTSAVRESMLKSIPAELSPANTLLKTPGLQEALAEALMASGFGDSIRKTLAELNEAIGAPRVHVDPAGITVIREASETSKASK